MLTMSLHAQVTGSQPAGGDSTSQGGPQKKDVEIITTDVFHFAKFGKDSVQIRKLLGNVRLRQDSTYIDCDSAYQFLDSNVVIAKGHVVITMPQSRTIYADDLLYQGDTKILTLEHNVRLQDTSITLYTDKLIYRRTENYGEYTTGGRLVSKENVLTSRKGYYYPDQSMAYFRDSVKLVNPDYTLVADTLGYNTDTRIAFFLSPTYVYDSTNTMYTEDGYYDTANDFAYLHTNARIGDTTYTLYADTIQYDQKLDLGKARGHVRAEQKDSTLTIFGQYGEFHSKSNQTYITDSTFAVQFTEDDTLYLYADTLHTYKDTTLNKRYFYAHYNTQIFMREMQGSCDSLAYHYDDSLLFMYQRPVIWSDESQVSGDTIIAGLKKGGIDTLTIPTGPMIAMKEDTVGYNQITGNSVTAKFIEKKLHKMWVNGNSESIYFTKDEKDGYIGMNKAKCTDMFIQFKDNKPISILFTENPEGEFFPLYMVLDKENTLPGFEWRESERPTRPLWMRDLVYKHYGTPDTLALRLDTLNQTLDRLETTLDSLFAAALPPLIDTLLPPDSIPSDSIPQDSLPRSGNDSIPSDTLNPDSPKGKGQSAQANSEFDYTGAGNRPQPPAPTRLTFKEWLKRLFAEPEVKTALRRDRQIAKIRRKADREANHRMGLADKRYHKSLKRVKSPHIIHQNPKIAQ